MDYWARPLRSPGYPKEYSDHLVHWCEDSQRRKCPEII
jgi:hypothetical protein